MLSFVYDYQGAYRKSKSTEQLLLVVIDAIVQAIDNKMLLVLLLRPAESL